MQQRCYINDDARSKSHQIFPHIELDKYNNDYADGNSHEHNT